VAGELTRLGEQPRIDEGGVVWQGDARSLMRANLWLRTASRVVVRVARFRATQFHELERHADRIPWRDFMRDPSAAEFRVTARKSRLYHSDAIAERLRTAALGGAAAGTASPAAGAHRQLFVVRAVRDEFEVSADSSGDLLHMRGYRQAVGKAPLRETLAAALLLAAGWDGETPLHDPFCGSGTIPIEGALIARRIAPGLRRAFAFEQWPGLDADDWRTLRDEALAGQLPRAPSAITGFDRDAGVVESAIANAGRAGVDADVTFAVHPLSAMEPLPAGSLVATNPPYGVRVSKGGDLRNLYAQLGNVLRDRAMGATLAIYLPRAHLARQTRLGLSEAFKTSNGGLPVAALVGVVS
jgi:putative N6-adenine-specific DNA methylase